MRYLELDAKGVVINIIIWDGISTYDSEYTLVSCDDAPMATYGWKFVNGVWVAPPELPEENL